MDLKETIIAGESGHPRAHEILHRHSNACVWADDYATLQAAIDAAQAGNMVLVPYGTRTLDTALVINKNIRLIGLAGPKNQPELRQKAAMAVISIDADAASHVEIDNFVLRGGTRAVNITQTNDGFLHRLSRFERLECLGQSGRAISVEAGVIGTSWRHINITGSAYGLYVSGPNAVNATIFEHLRVRQTTAWAVYVENTNEGNLMTGVGFVNPTIEHNSGGGIRLRRTYAMLQNPFFEVNGEASGDADIELAGDDLGAGAAATTIGGNMGTPAAAQSHRVTVQQDRCFFVAIGTPWPQAATIDVGGNSNCRIEFVGLTRNNVPSVVNQAPDTIVTNTKQ